MRQFCTNCGHTLPPEAQFCDNCGAAVQAPAQTTRPPQAGGAAPQPYYPAHAGGQAGGGRNPRERARGILCIVLSILLLLQITLVALYGWPGFARKDRAERASAESSAQRAEMVGLSDITLKSSDYKVTPLRIPVGPEDTVVSAGGDRA